MSASDAAGLWPVYASLQRQLLQAPDTAALGFVMANETWHLVPYQQACVCLYDAFGRIQLQTVSGLTSVHESTPFTQWIQKVAVHCLAQTAPQGGSAAMPLTAGDLPAELAAPWHEWWPGHALCVPLDTLRGQRVGALLLTSDRAWTDAQRNWLQLLRDTGAHAFAQTRRGSAGWRERWQRWRQNGRRSIWVAAGLLALMAVPVRTSVLAPAEVIALKAQAVAAPADGVVKVFHVEPNRAVRAGDLLLSLDETTLRNRMAVATETLAVARADAQAAQQRAFDPADSRSDLSALQGKVKERAAELAFLRESLQRLDVHASQDGIFVYGDPSDWLGKPVTTGERLGQLAQPEALGVLVWLPVPDAINLQLGAAMKVYLQVQPLDALSAQLEQTSYQAALSPEGVASYKVRGRLVHGEAAHIGLRGVAKIEGERYPLAYWIFRRPLGALRQWVGV